MKQTIQHDELLDLVNIHDQVIGQAYRSVIYKHNYRNFRVINAFVINDQHQLWIPIRSAEKKLFPLCLDASVGGHVIAGEDYDTAFRRETMEELNLDIRTTPYKFLTSLTPHEHETSAFMKLYAIYTNQTPLYNKNDFCDSMWVSLENLEMMIDHGAKTKGDLPLLLNALKNIV